MLVGGTPGLPAAIELRAQDASSNQTSRSSLARQYAIYRFTTKRSRRSGQRFGRACVKYFT